MTRLKILGSLVGAALAIALAGCGDNSAECGDGTHEEDGLCLPDATCGEGTIEGPDGQCIPDGSVICEQGTVFDEAAGGCVPSDDACADGTVLIDGQCVADDDALTADHEEEAEPNDGALDSDGIAGDFDLPAIGAPGVVIHGCIDPYRDLDGNVNPDADEDLWFVTTSGPALIEIAADGVHGLAAGFYVLPGAANQVGLVDNGWIRLGINLTGDTSERQVYLPYAGAYALVMADSRALFLSDGAAGSDEACYYTTVRQVALPTPIAAPGDTQLTGTVGTDTIFYSYNPAANAIVLATHEIPSEAASGSVLALRNNAFDAYGDASGTTTTVGAGGMLDADNELFVVEPVYNYALNPLPYTFKIYDPTVGQLPEDGDIVVVNGDQVDDLQADDLLAYVDVAAGEVVRFQFETSDDTAGTPDVEIIFWGPGFYTEYIGGGDVTDSFDGWVKFPSAGRYYVGFTSYADAPAMFTVSSTVTHVTPTPITHGTPLTSTLGNNLSQWYTYDPGTEPWVAFTASGTGTWGASDISLNFYDLAGFGLAEDPNTASSSTYGVLLEEFFFTGGGDVTGLITQGLPLDFLVRVFDSYEETAVPASGFTLDFADRDFTDLGTVTTVAPIALDNETSTAPDLGLYFVRGTPGNNLNITVTPNPASTSQVDLAIFQLNLVEGRMRGADDGIENDAETLDYTQRGGTLRPGNVSIPVPATGWVAFGVRDFGGTDHGFDIDITATAPIAYADICGGQANVLAQTGGIPGDDSITAVQTLPFTLSWFGSPVTSYWVSSNGFLSFAPSTNNTFFGNSSIPAAGNPNGVLAPYWDDLANVVICKTEVAADRVTVQWNGIVFGSADPVQRIQMQTVIHADGTIDFIYGGPHGASGGSATVGAENLAGTLAVRFGFNLAGLIVGGSSMTFRTAPPS